MGCAALSLRFCLPHTGSLPRKALGPAPPARRAQVGRTCTGLGWRDAGPHRHRGAGGRRAVAGGAAHPLPLRPPSRAGSLARSAADGAGVPRQPQAPARGPGACRPRWPDRGVHRGAQRGGADRGRPAVAGGLGGPHRRGRQRQHRRHRGDQGGGLCRLRLAHQSGRR